MILIIIFFIMFIYCIRRIAQVRVGSSEDEGYDDHNDDDENDNENEKEALVNKILRAADSRVSRQDVRAFLQRYQAAGDTELSGV
jgi:hypothetical protein